MSSPDLASRIINSVAWLVPSDMRREWRREWDVELAWGRQSGRPPSEQLRRAIGGVPHACWLRADGWRRQMVWQDFRYGARALRARPALAIISILSLALGIGANVAIFTVVEAVLLRPLPFEDAARIVQLANRDNATTLSGPELFDLRRESKTLSPIGAFAMANGNVTGGRSDAERVRVARVTAGFFEVLRPSLVVGRPFTTAEDRPGAADVVVVGRELSVRAFGSPEDAAGKTLLLNGAPRIVIGVMPAAFGYPAPGVDVWIPLALDPANPGERRNHNYRVIGRLAGSATVANAQAEVDAQRGAWQRQYPGLYDPSRPLVADVVTIGDRILGATRPYLLAMLGAVAFVLLIGCANVASLLLIYGESRRKDLAISIAMGASRSRLAMRSMSESLLLAGGGGALGAVLAVPVYRVLVALAPASIPRVGEAHVDLPVLAFALAVSIASALASGLVPLVRVFRETDSAALRSTGRSPSPAGGKSMPRMHSALVVAEVALAAVMLGGATLLARSLINLQRTDLGFSPQHVMTARVSLPRPAYDDTKAVATIQAMVARLQEMPGARRASAMAWTPIADGGGMWSIEADGRPPRSNADAPTAAPQQVTPGFFQTLSTPILRGRDFTWADGPGAQLVAIVNEGFGRLLWKSDDPLGRRFRMFAPNAQWVTIVGVVPDSRVDGIMEAAPPVMYFPHAQAGLGSYFISLDMTLAVSYDGEAPLAPAIRRVVRDLDPNVPVSDVRTLEDVVGSTIAQQRFTSALVAGFAVLAGLLAGVGIYGVIAYGVAQRRFEIGVRMALGAARREVLGSVVRRGLGLSLAGLGIGLVGVATVGRLLGTLLYEVDVLDPASLGVAACVLLVVTLAALVVPARRAMNVNPVEVLSGR